MVPSAFITSTIVAVGAGGAGARVEVWLDSPPAPGSMLVVTAGGQQLVPPWLVVGRATFDGEELRLDVPDRWPARVDVAVFRYSEERRRLWRGRR